MAEGLCFQPSGWDECFPTIEPYGASPILGDLVWTPPRYASQEGVVVQEWAMPAYVATRSFQAEDASRLCAQFAVRNLGGKPLPFLWASHSLFTFAGLQRVMFADGATLDDFRVDGTSSKTFRLNHGPVRLLRDDCEVVLETDQRWWGIWYNRGGWPAKRPAGVGVLGLEATNEASDLPGGAVIGPHGEFRGYVKVGVNPKGVGRTS